MKAIETKTKPKGKAPREPQRAFVVEQDCSDEVMRKVCAAKVEGWDTLRADEQVEAMRLMRLYQKGQRSALMEIVQEGEKRFVGFADTANVTLQSLRLVETFGTRSQELVNDRVGDLVSYPRPSSKGGLSPGDEQLNAALAFVAGGKPEDSVQSTLLVQMAATHDAAMRALGAAARAEFVQQVQMWGNLSAKLLNTYTRQAEVLAKLQRGGEQVVKHIHIDNRGGQAVVTEQVVAGGGVKSKVGEQPYEQGSPGPALLGTDPLGNVVPMPSAEGQEAVQTARRRVTRSAEG